MARRWTPHEERMLRSELRQLYVIENKTIGEVGRILGVAGGTIFDRLVRLGIPTLREQKTNFNNRRNDVRIVDDYSAELSELFGILLGDGHISHFQVMVTLGTKELSYARYVRRLLQNVFGGVPKIITSSRNDRTVYLGSTVITKWLKAEGLVQNKVAAQVDVPSWLFNSPDYMTGFIRGFFDTDGSVYKLRYVIQISFCNKSLPLLYSLHNMLKTIGYNPSAVSGYNIYLTRKEDVQRFFREVKPANVKHQRRYKELMRRWRSSKRT